jgi:hypothetical protein
MTVVPERVREVTDLFLHLADARLPGCVEGLYLRGSLAFGEWHDGRSDIDFVAVLDRRADSALTEALRGIHVTVAEAFAKFDGFHVTWDDLAAGPDATPDVPCTQGGWFHEESRLDVNPVAWHEVADRGLAVRGPAVGAFPLWVDRRALATYTRTNLVEYWAAELEQLRRFPAEAAAPDILTWYALGVPRLHHLLATGELTSKSGAGRYAKEVFGPTWHPLIDAALAIREGRVPNLPEDAGQLLIGFVDRVIADALAVDVTQPT